MYAAIPGVTPDVVLSTHIGSQCRRSSVAPRMTRVSLWPRDVRRQGGVIAAQVAAADRLREAGVKVGLLFVRRRGARLGGRVQVANPNPRGFAFPDQRRADGQSAGAGHEGRACAWSCARMEKMAHSAYPKLGESAIDKLVEALHDVLAMPVAGRAGDRADDL